MSKILMDVIWDLDDGKTWEFFTKLLKAPIPKICVENPTHFKILRR